MIQFAKYLVNLVVLVLVSNVVLVAQSTKLDVKLSKSEFVIGDHIQAKIYSSELPDGTKLTSSNIIKAFEQSGLDIIDVDTTQTLLADSLGTIVQSFVFSGFQDGAFYLPSIKNTVQLPNGIMQILVSDSIQLMVNTVSVDTTQDIRPIVDIVEVEWTMWERFMQFLSTYKYWLIIILAVILLALYFIKWYKRRNNSTTTSTKLSLEEKYLQQINLLESKNYLEHDDFKQYYSELSDILRTYINDRFLIAAPELTTQELLKVTKRVGEIKKHRPFLKSFLQTSDMIKFAKASTNIATAKDDLQNVVKFIKTTRIKETEG